MAWIRMIDRSAAEGELRDTYAALAARPLPAAYHPPHGGAAGIMRAHSMDPALMRLVFSTSGSTFQGDHLTWAERETIAAVASRTNQCLY